MPSGIFKSIVIGIFLIIVFGPVMYMFFDSCIVDGKISLVKYRDIFQEARQMGIFLNTIALGLATAFFSLLIGVPLACILYRTDIRLAAGIKYLYLVPLLIPPFISAIGWIELLPLSLYGLPASALILGLSYYPFVTILAMSGLMSIDTQLEEAGALVCSGKKVFARITLPLIKPHLIAAGVFVFIFAISNYSIPSLLRLNTYPVEIFAQFSAFYDTQKAFALASPLIVLTTALVFLANHHMRSRSYVNTSGANKPHVYSLGRKKILALFFVYTLIVVSVIIPLAMLVKRAGGVASYKAAFKTAGGQILNSMLLAALGATVIVFFSFFISYFLNRTAGKGKKALEAATILPLAIPSALVAIGLIGIWNRQYTQFLYATWMIIILGYMGRFLPFIIITIGAQLKKIPLEFEEASYLVDIHWFSRITRIILPLLGPGLIIAWVIAFILSIGELETTLLIIPPGETVLPIRIFTLMHYGANKLVAALCIILLTLTILPAAAIAALRKRTELLND